MTDADLPDDPTMDIHEGDMPCARIQCLRELWRGRQDHNRKSWESTTPPCPEGTNAEAPPIPPVAKFEQARQGGRLQSRHAEQATSMKAIVERLATEDGELLYSAIRAGLADGPRTATTTS